MNLYEEHINAGIARAAQMTERAEPMLSAFLASVRVQYDRTSGEPYTISVLAHVHAWTRYLAPGTFADCSPNQIAEMLIAWVQDAVKKGLLTADDPPTKGPVDPHARIIDLMQARRAEILGTDNAPPA